MASKAPPAAYEVEALERYLMYRGAITQGHTLVSRLEKLADVFDRAASDGTPVRGVVGDDPVADDFLATYAEGEWINRERKRLVEAIDRAEGENGSGRS